MARSVTGWIGIALLSLAAGCVHQPPPLDFSGPRGKARLASVPAGPQDQLARGWARLVIKNDLVSAREDFQLAATNPAADARTRLLASLGLGFEAMGRAEFTRASQEFLAALEADPAAPEALVAAWQLRECTGMVPEGQLLAATRVKALLDRSPPPPPDLARSLRFLLHEEAMRAGRWEDASAMARALGVPPSWRTVFPFGRQALVSFEQPFPPESGPLAETSSPLRLPVWPDDLTLLLDREEREGLLYAEAFFQVTADTPLVLRLQGPGTWAVFFDDQLLESHDPHRARLPQVVRLPIQVAAGWHRLLLKIPLRQGKASLGVELSSASGYPSPVRWWNGEGNPPAYRTAKADLQRALASPAQILARQSQESPGDAVTAMLAGLVTWEDGDLDAAQDHLDRAQRAAPDFAFLYYLNGVLGLDDLELPATIGAARAREQFKRASELCPELLLARFRFALLESGDGREEQALEILQQLESIRSDAFLWPFFSAEVYEKLGWDLEAGLAYRLALRRLPDYPEAWLQAFRRELRNHTVGEADRLAQQLLQSHQESQELIDFWIERGRPDLARTAQETLIRRFPSRLGPRLSRIDLEMSQGNLEEAGRVLAEAEAVFGPTTELLRRKADLLDRQHRTAEALALHRQSVVLAPWHLQSRQGLAAAEGRSGIHLAGERTIGTGEAIAAYRASGFTPEGSAVAVLDQASLEVAADGSSVERIRMILQILTPEGMERWGEIQEIPAGATTEVIRTIGADGRVHDAELIPGKESVSLPGLQVGDFIEFSYLQGARARLASAGYAAQRFYFRTLGMPIFRSLYTVAVPAGQALQIDSHFALPTSRVAREGDFEVYTWEQNGAALIVPEPNAPPADEYTPFVQVGFSYDWKDYRDLLRAEMEEATRPNFEICQYVQRVAPAGLTDRERVRRLFRAVGNDVRRSTPSDDFSEPASSILARRAGNRLVLLAALLRAAGYQPGVLLARTVSSSQARYLFPNASTFEYGLVLITLPGGKESLWLDPAERNTTFGSLYPFLWGQEALSLTSPPGSDPFLRLPTSFTPPPSKEIHLDFTLTADGTLAGSGNEHITSAQAVKYREVLGSISPLQRQQTLQQGLGSYFSGAVLESYELGALEDPEQPFELKYRLRAPGFGRRHGDTLLLQGGFYPYQLSANLLTKPVRQLPLLLEDETRTSTEVVLVLPRGAKAELPRAAHWTAPQSEFWQSAHQEGDRVVIEKKLLVKAGRISPEEFPAFREFCQKVDARDTETIEVRLPATLTADGVKPPAPAAAATTATRP